MNLLFRGWKREVKEHNRGVVPVTRSGGMYSPGECGGPLTWNSALQALGKIDDLALCGSFLVEFNFQQEELRHWLRQFVLARPEDGVRLLAEMQGEAILALAKKTEERASRREGLETRILTGRTALTGHTL